MYMILGVSTDLSVSAEIFFTLTFGLVVMLADTFQIGPMGYGSNPIQSNPL